MTKNKEKTIFVFLLLFLIVLAFSVSATTKEITLHEGESVVIEDRNITLVNSGDNAIVVCVNGQKGIISKDMYFKDVYFELKSTYDTYASLKLKTSCSDRSDNCVCDNDKCSNKNCAGFEYLVENKTENKSTEEPTIEEKNLEENKTSSLTTEETQKEQSKLTIPQKIAVILLITLIVLIVIYLSIKFIRKY